MALLRSNSAANALLIGALAGATALATFTMVSAQEEQAASTSASTSSASSTSPATSMAAASFTTADVGSCVTWQQDSETNAVTSFERTDCNAPHRFEVAARQDLGAYPTSEFGKDAPIPDMARQAQLREELCHTPTINYLNGRFDPTGRYSIASILPPAEAWEAGDRTLLCGVQSTDPQGNVLETTGPISENDQARVAQPGQCLRVDASNSITPVDCAQEHHIEVTSIVNLKEIFPEGIPDEGMQDAHLQPTCDAAAIEYLGEEENLYQSTLQPFWLSIPPESWAGGSHSTNCGLIFADEGGFATLQGSAKDGREGFTINGNHPEEQPERNPLREEAAP